MILGIHHFKGGLWDMQCGAKCFIVEVELNGEKKSVPVTARSPIQARKAVRLQYEELVKIISVKSENQ